MFAPISPTLGSRRVLTALLCAYTEAGTIPGAPLADLLYQLVIASSYQCLWDCLRAEDLLEHVGTVEACLLTWLDDFAIPVGADSAQALPCRLGRVASLTASGISMNFSPGKSEAGQAKRQIFVENAGHIPVMLPAGHSARLVCTDHYIHLGTCRGPDRTATSDLLRRRALTQPVCQKVCTRLN